MDLLVLVLLAVAAVVGIVPAVVAYNKGRNPVWWWVFGVALPIVAIPLVFMVEDKTEKKCPKCGALIRQEAVSCFCGHEFTGSEGDFDHG